MITKKICAIAFDLDGTLVDSALDLTAAMQATLVELNLPSCSEDQVRSWVGKGVENLVKQALIASKNQQPDDALMAQAMPLFMANYERFLEKHSKLYPNVLPVLNQLHNQGYKLAVVTNKPYRFTIPLLDGFGITDLFCEILGGDSLERMKPDPLPLTHLLNKWSLQPEQLLMVGDSKNDILAAKAANVASVGLTYGYNYGEDISLSHPDAVCDNFNQIQALLAPENLE